MDCRDRNDSRRRTHVPGEEATATSTTRDATQHAVRRQEEEAVQETFSAKGPFVFRKVGRPTANRASGILPLGCMPFAVNWGETSRFGNIAGLAIPPPIVATIKTKATSSVAARNYTAHKDDDDDIAEKSPSFSWECEGETCKMLNTNDNTSCEKCGKARNDKVTCSLADLFKNISAGKWKCEVCRVLNPDAKDKCEACQNSKGNAPAAPSGANAPFAP